jgi:hypothetical protein
MKTLGLFCLRFALCFVLLTWPWPGLRNTVGAAFRAQARLLVGIVLPKNNFRVEKLSDPHYANLDTLLMLADTRHAGPGGPIAVQAGFDSNSQAWIPFAMLIALIVPTPVPWPKRLKGLLAGGIALELLIAATVLISIPTALASDSTPAWLHWLLGAAGHLLSDNTWFTFVPSVFLWAIWIAWAGYWKQLGDQLIRKSKT